MVISNVSQAVNASLNQVLDLGNNLKDLPPELVSKVADLIFILKAAGILLIFYILFLIVKGILDLIRNWRIRKIYKKVYEIDEKVDRLLKDKKKR